LKDELNEERSTEHLLPKLQSTLEKLSEQELYLIELRFFEELSFKEIGEILSITEVHAKVKTYRTLDKLRKFLTSGK
ncbi:unnamed protein product, partial [Phaeothamnion confervicola]